MTASGNKTTPSSSKENSRGISFMVLEDVLLLGIDDSLLRRVDWIELSRKDIDVMIERLIEAKGIIDESYPQQDDAPESRGSEGNESVPRTRIEDLRGSERSDSSAAGS